MYENISDEVRIWQDIKVSFLLIKTFLIEPIKNYLQSSFRLIVNCGLNPIGESFHPSYLIKPLMLF